MREKGIGQDILLRVCDPFELLSKSTHLVCHKISRSAMDRLLHSRTFKPLAASFPDIF